MNQRLPTPGREIISAILLHGLQPDRVDLISPLGDAKGRRLAYRVEGPDGQFSKFRLFEDEATARRVFDLRATLESAFAPACARYERVLVEQWVEGRPLSSREEEAWIEWAGAALGRLHAQPLPAGHTPTLPTAPWKAAATSDLELLAQADTLTSREISRLGEEIERRDPGHARAAIAHLDFCGDNMVIDSHGRVRIIDNELLEVNAAGFDLCRTFLLWPGAARSWASFLEGYRSSAPADPGPPGF